MGFDSMPQSIAAFTFLPLGIVMGNILYFYFTDETTIIFLSNIQFWPFFAAGALALVTATIMTYRKLKAKKYEFEHFYYMTFGMFFVLLGGNLLLNTNDPEIGIYFCLMGHGIAYIPTLAYINIRASKFESRSIKISLAHKFYMIGIAIGATIFYESIESTYSFVYIEKIINNIGYAIIISSSFALLGYILNELLQKCSSKYNYKKSLDNDFERENNNLTIFDQKHFEITQSPAYNIQSMIQTQVIPDMHSKDAVMIIFSIFSKATSFLYFYYPFYYLNVLVSNYTEGIFYIIHWFGLAGIILSLFLLRKQSTRSIFVISSVLKITSIILVTMSGIWWFSFTITKIMFWIHFFILGFGYSMSDILTLELTKLKHNEFVLGLGYAVEMIVIGTIQYYSIIDLNDMFRYKTLIEIILPHSITLCIILTAILIFGLYVIPRYHNVSLLAIKNIVRCHGIKFLSSTNNGVVQRNPQSQYQQQLPVQQQQQQLPVQQQQPPIQFIPPYAPYTTHTTPYQQYPNAPPQQYPNAPPQPGFNNIQYPQNYNYQQQFPPNPYQNQYQNQHQHPYQHYPHQNVQQGHLPNDNPPKYSSN